ncbi:porin [Botrimarina mediterranea]|uniref:Porin n=1 Tax=Botrimarina mediterranea TaxID=2528022 RepID=A0A518K747_9BACT|nr:porin [Botrimarina mediterranea]QDV73609.1 hypothetical protein Spa11_18070 [Botrimarina mediterranea]QDV78199.1 hypothetical protein K2D_18050 [Planctomycetes bacterium K2D]
MKRHALAGLTAFAVAGYAAADQVAQPASVAPAPLQYETYYNQPVDTLPSVTPPNPAVTSDVAYNIAPSSGYEPSCTAEPNCAVEPNCAAEPSCGLESCCGDACGCGSTCGLLGDCCLGDPWTLQGYLDPCGCSPITFGGWTQIGFHTQNTRFSRDDNDAFAFNDHPGRLNLHQQWFYAEKVAEAPCCGVDWGFRADLMYGTDAVKTQSFGNPAGSWDFQNGWDEGAGYGWAMPQLYGEVAWGDWSVKVGHFFTLIGYEVVTAPDNFFYSHAFTMFNSEPFTHTGAIATYNGFDDVTLYGGWTAGWDTGFDSFNDGSNFLGGFSTGLTDDITFTYMLTAGNFGKRSAGGDGYSHSVVVDFALTDDLNYVLQSDLVDIDDQNGNVTANDQVGINQYLFYTMNDCWAVGARLEWWKTDGFSYQEMTYGLNYRPHANVVIRPEIRYDWTASDAAANNVGFADAEEFNSAKFGMDAIFTF